MVLKRAFKADTQLAERGKPRMRALHHPTMFAEAVVLLDAPTSNPGNDAALVQVLSAACKVVALVGVKLVRAASGATTEARHAGYGVDKCFERYRIVAIRACDSQRQGHAPLVHNQVTLAAEFAPIRGVWASLFAPRGLDTDAPSIQARLQSIWSCSRRRLSRARCNRPQTPSDCQSRNRRPHVMPLPKPSSCGKSSHGIPVCRTNRMPFRAARFSTRGRPPLAEGAATGNSGSSAFHSSLLIFRRAMPPLTLLPLLSMTWFC